ncbi:porin family protein [Fluviicola taffensis]|uniref:porin family protein n=1 Tax=Fluviicola taffensis TaxID=191579 RepID=UPI003137C590
MKNILIALSFVFFGTTTSLHAQNSMFDLGLEGGPNLSTILVSSTLFDFDPQPAVFGSGGFIFQYNFKNFLSLKTGISYQRKGYQLKDLLFTDNSGNQIGTGTTSSRLDYLTFPILVKASFGKKVNFFVNAGPYIGYLLQKTDRTKFDGSTTTFKDDLSINGMNRWDFGVAGGIGIAIPIRTFWVISIEARNYSGLLDIAKSSNTKWLTNTTDLRVGVAYKLGFYKDEE